MMVVSAAAVLCLFGLSVLCLETVSALPTFPNIAYLAHGYDVVKANPSANEVDPGWRKYQPILSLSFDDGHTYQGQYAVPDQSTVLDTPSCSYQGQSSVLQTAKQYQSALNVSIYVEEDADLKLFGITLAKESFSASADYQKLFKGGQSGTTSYVGTSATCVAYSAAWTEFGWSPTFSSTFQAAVEGLGSSVPFLEFVTAFGTHYVRNMDMGGSSFYYSTFETTALNSFIKQYYSAGAQLSASLDFIVHAHGSISGEGSHNEEMYQAYSQAKQSSVAFGIPFPAPPCNGSAMCSDISAWASSIQLPYGQPVPLHTTLRPVVELLTAQNFPKDGNITAKAKALTAFLVDSYCGEVPNCGVPPSPTPSPKPWGQFMHDAGHSGRSPNLGPRGPQVYAKWTYTTGSSVSSSPAIGADGTVYVGSNDHNVYALDGSTGTLKWTYTTDGPVESSPAIGADGTVYVGSNDFYALDGSTGTLKWKYPTGAPVTSSPAIGADGTVYVGSSGYIALNGTTGAVKWQYTTGFFVYSSPAIGVDGMVYVASYDYNVYALDGTTGAVKWTSTTGGSVYSSPAIGADGTVYVGSNDKNVYALDGTTGAIKWKYTTGSYVDSSPAIGADGTVYVGSNDKNVYALDGTTGAVKWKYTTGDSVVDSSAAISVDGTVYIASGDHNLYALDGTTGAVKWKYKTGDVIESSPAIGADGTVYVGSNDNKVYAFHDV